MFLIGTAVFGAASLLDGLATSQGMLIVARALQGAGAALATPAALALVTGLFPAGAARTRALTMWGALAGLGFAASMPVRTYLAPYLDVRRCHKAWVGLQAPGKRDLVFRSKIGGRPG